MSVKWMVFWMAFAGGGFIAIMVDDWSIKLPLMAVFAFGCGLIGAWSESHEKTE